MREQRRPADSQERQHLEGRWREVKKRKIGVKYSSLRVILDFHSHPALENVFSTYFQKLVWFRYILHYCKNMQFVMYTLYTTVIEYFLLYFRENILKGSNFISVSNSRRVQLSKNSLLSSKMYNFFCTCTPGDVKGTYNFFILSIKGQEEESRSNLVLGAPCRGLP